MAPPVSGTPVDAIVKWFKSDKGFGFVELSNGAGDAFLHIGALQAAGFETVPPGAKLKVYVGTGAKGAQVTRVLEVDTAGAAERAPPPRFNEARPPPRAIPILRPPCKSAERSNGSTTTRASASSSRTMAARTSSSISRSSARPAFSILLKANR